MAGNQFPVIEVIDLTHVTGGVDKQTRAAQLAIAQATSAVDGVAKAVAPNADGMAQMMMQMMNNRRSGAGPTPAPALPPASTLTR
jgi:hypothetical protein